MKIWKAVFVHCIALYCSSCKLVEFGICRLPVSGLVSGSDVGVCVQEVMLGVYMQEVMSGVYVQEVMSGVSVREGMSGVYVQEVMSGV